MEPYILARFWRKLYQIVWSVFLPKLPLDPIPNELVSRYLTQSGHYAESTDRVKANAFHPARRDHKTSVFRIQALTENQIWKLGDVYVAASSGKKIRARAELSVTQITDIGLRVEPDEPPIRHSNIVGWPNGKDALMSQAQEVAAVAVLRVRI